LTVEKGIKILVYVIRPKSLLKENNACQIDAHGGGAVMFEAKMFNG